MELSADITAEDIKVFIQEADEQLQLLDEDIIKLEGVEDNTELLQEIFRAAHTIKGSSAVLGHQKMAQLAHVMENILDQLRKGSLAVTPLVIDALLHGLDSLRTLKDEIVSSEDSGLDIAPMISELESVIAEPGDSSPSDEAESTPTLVVDQAAESKLTAALASGNNAYRIKVNLNKDTSFPAIRCFQVLTDLSQLGEIPASAPSLEEIEQEKASLNIELVLVSSHGVDKLQEAVLSVEDVENVEIVPYLPEPTAASAPEESQGGGTATKTQGQQSQTVRIDVERLDSLMNAIGELVVDRTRMLQVSKQLSSRYKEDESVVALGVTTTHVAKLIGELRDDIMKVRMLPIGTVFNGFPRMVRDLTRGAGKQLDFVVEGQQTEIDRTVIERIRDPLVHLIRNVVDHGIEMPEVRKAAGKPEKGNVRLAAFHEHGQIVIIIEDDGKGIDPKTIKEAAVRKKAMSAEAVAKLSDAEAIDLIFKPGISTAQTTSEISGRGVGMDIVRANIEAINGSVTVDTKVGQGTRFTLTLPLTLAILQGLLVRSNDALYAIPLAHVQETFKLEHNVVKVNGKNDVIAYRGKVLPLLRIGAIFNTENGKNGHNGSGFAVVVQIGGKSLGLLVDSLMESQEIVIKSLGAYIGQVKGIVGASILGDGSVVLILDVASMIGVAASVGS